ncbi:hypothetical protein F511_20527 [Dorcoceras hygrometricum]|uniref:Uncharacterized protein n=1 Tax=Dorcoceras hygrometricum TaxID=472368 RepID=A0A2Z7D804_9LAMI|nr:hypothetical protein F511_20527 [Dorcoceras hygrometricum]
MLGRDMHGGVARDAPSLTRNRLCTAGNHRLIICAMFCATPAATVRLPDATPVDRMHDQCARQRARSCARGEGPPHTAAADGY